MRLQWTDNAHDDLFRIADFLEAEHVGSSTGVLLGVLTSADLLIEHPHIGPVIVGSQIRKWPVPDSSLLLLYQVSDDLILILRLVHNRSDWQSLL